MHACPDCGHECTCNGDFDDCEVLRREWVYQHCEHCADACPDCGCVACECDDDARPAPAAPEGGDRG